jgi:2-oxoglutarate ferredoxin oxidoreductase subunit beta
VTSVSGQDIVNGHDTEGRPRTAPPRTERPNGRPGGPAGRRAPAAAPTAPIGPGLTGVPLALEPLNRKDFTSDQEVRWCPGCGDYAVLAAFQGFMPELGIRKENTVIVSGIGCSSRFPYYVDSYGMHSIHGRATAIATGVATAREDAAVFVITGDGDALSIGGNHLIHVLRRNVNVTILLFNNRIYGLTKGQYSPTSEIGKITKSTPMGSLDNPFNPVSLALGAEATFVARTIDSDRKHLTEVLRAAAAHRGTSFVEIYQNCPIFNDDAFSSMKDAETSAEAIIPLRHGEPIRFGVEGSKGVVRNPVSGAFEIVDVDSVGADRLVVHDAHTPDPSFAFGLSRLTDSGVLHRAPIGIFRDVEAPAYDDLAREQVKLAADKGSDDDALQAMIAGPDTWTVVG